MIIVIQCGVNVERFNMGRFNVMKFNMERFAYGAYGDTKFDGPLALSPVCSLQSTVH